MESKTISALVAKVMAILNITEEGKIQNFFSKQSKVLEREAKYLAKNIETITDNKVDYLSELQENIEDARVKIEDAYANIKLENVSNNDTANAFAETYWTNIEKAEKDLFKLNKVYEEAEKDFNKQIKDVEDQLLETKRRLIKIS